MSQNDAPAKTKAGLFQDDDGNNSSMRLMSLISLLAAIGTAAADIAMNGNHQDLTVIFMAGAFAPKVLQKVAEKWKA